MLFQVPFYTVRYDLIGDEEANTFFRVNPISGVVELTRPLSLDPSFYSVTVRKKHKPIV